MTFGRWKDNVSKRFFYRQNKPSLLFYPSLARGSNEVTSLWSHPPSFFGRKCRECILPFQLRFLADVWAHHLCIPTGLLSCLSFALLCSPLASSAQETESQLSSQSAGSPRPSGSSNHEPADIFLSEAASFISPLSMWNDSSNVRLPPWKAVEFTFCLSLISFHKPPQTS